MQQAEDKLRFIVRHGIVFGLVTGVLWLCAMRFLGTQLDYSPQVVLAVLALWVVAGPGWALLMWRYLQRSRQRNETFYSQLRGEMTEQGAPAPEPEEAEQRYISVVMTKYTLRESFALTLLSLYGTPARAARTIALPMLFGAVSMALPIGSSSAATQLLKFLSFGLAFSCFFTGLIALSTRRLHNKIWRGGRSGAIRFTPGAVEMTQDGHPLPGIPWTSIDSVREAGGYFVFVRGKRFLLAIPKDRVGENNIGELRRLLRAAKGEHAYLRS